MSEDFSYLQSHEEQISMESFIETVAVCGIAMFLCTILITLLFFDAV